MKNISQGTEKPICDMGATSLRFLMFCPVHLQYAVQKTYYPKVCALSALQGRATERLPAWIVEKNELSSIYKNLIVFDLQKGDYYPLLQDYFQGFSFAGDACSIADYLEEEYFQPVLIYNFKLKQFMLSLELSFSVPTAHIVQNRCVQVCCRARGEIDFYNCVRNGIVSIAKEKDSAFVCALKAGAFEKVRQVITQVYDMPLTTDALYTEYNSGNITVLAVSDQANAERVKDCLFETNKQAERIEYMNNSVSFSYAHCAFNGRFHTICMTQEKYRYHFVPITFQAQFVWSYLRTMSIIIENLNVSLQEDKRIAYNDENKSFIMSIIEMMRILSYENDAFKFSIENENGLIYKKFEDAWYLQALLESEEKYIDDLNQLLTRIYMDEAEKTNSKQNNILFAISVLQVLSIISVWGDFLALDDVYGAALFTAWGGPWVEVVQMLNTMIPAAMVLVSAILLLKILRQK